MREVLLLKEMVCSLALCLKAGCGNGKNALIQPPCAFVIINDQPQGTVVSGDKV